jgi:terminal uridylyltransferase
MDIFSNKELYPGRTEHPYEEDEMKPKRIVDGWNAWFFDDMQRLIKVWAGFGENRQSVGTLWLGFLDYYARCFDEKNEVVCIRQSRVLSKFEKMWNSPCIAIEDPFDLSHNLGAGISRKSKYIMKIYDVT